MRTLVLMRHAKTEPNHPMGDKARRLTMRGRSDAADVGRQLADRAIDLVLCSSAERTRQTVEHLGLDARVEYMDVLYSGGVETMLQRISEIDDEVTSLLVVGHSPTIPWLSSQLAAASAPRQADEIGCWFPTAAWTEFTLEGSWSDLHPDHFATDGAEQTRLVGLHRRDSTP
ncbi:SixA phosphatase family protein [Aestuariimicrobium ganziense]|uniref:SixA phosphatase family protein n=1 Tax=Aestuariimicrobium ganziense TaxID=2773677 RepID=UPI0019422B71|nr:histidine phosphatase family protein [Aestuariimicrobium ganziense]